MTDATDHVAISIMLYERGQLRAFVDVTICKRRHYWIRSASRAGSSCPLTNGPWSRFPHPQHHPGQRTWVIGGMPCTHKGEMCRYILTIGWSQPSVVGVPSSEPYLPSRPNIQPSVGVGLWGQDIANSYDWNLPFGVDGCLTLHSFP